MNDPNRPDLPTVRNLARNVVRPRYAAEMIRKVGDRIRELRHPTDRDAVRRWCTEQAEDPATYFAALDPDLWPEANEYADGFAASVSETLAQTGLRMGGGGDYRVLFFLTRYLRPRTVVETGVAAGYSSAAILSGMARNQSGHLWSSDLPYFRHENPEDDIGIFVDPELRDRWTLLSKGDRENLPRILEECGPVELFHYDSDKSVRGRDYAVDLLSQQFTQDAVVLFDDINDNFHFRDWSAKQPFGGHVFEFKGKYVGVVSLGAPLGQLRRGTTDPAA